MMTDHDIRKLRRITGLHVYQDEKAVHGRDLELEWIAVSVELSCTADDFLKANLDRLRRQLLREQNYRCGFCAQIRPLQIHHEKKRSQGRDDRKSNLILLCFSCHEKTHRT